MKARFLLLAAISCVGAVFGLTACGGGDDEPTLADFCPSYVALQDKTDALNEASDAELAERKDALNGFVTALEDLAGNSPEEVKADVEESADWASGAEDAIADTESISDLEEAGQQYTEDNPQPEKASQEADDFARENCDGDQPAEGSEG